MTFDIALVLAILFAAVLLLVTEWLRVDLVALLVLAALAVTGLVSSQQALAGFSNSAVITVGAMFVLSAALTRTGVAAAIGRHVLRLAGRGAGEPRLVLMIMLTAGVLSSVINNLGVVAMLLPATMDVARRTGVAPSRLLLPLALGAHLGGLTTLVGTPPNIVVSDALTERGFQPLHLFDFTPVGVLLLLVGVAYVSLAGRRILPQRDTRSETHGAVELAESFELQERLFHIRVPARSSLAGLSLAESRLGSVLGVHVLAILRPHDTLLAPGPAAVLREGDVLLVQGRPDLLLELRRGRHLSVQDDSRVAERLVSDTVAIAEARVPPGSKLDGRTLAESALRTRTGLIVLAVLRGETPMPGDLQDIALRGGDLLLLQGTQQALTSLAAGGEIAEARDITVDEAVDRYRLRDRFLTLRVTSDSMLNGRTLAETRLGDAAGVTVLGIVRDGTTRLMIPPGELLEVGDELLVKARPDALAVLRGLRKLEIDDRTPPDVRVLESERVGLLEVVLSPRSELVGRTPRLIRFREKYGLSVLAIWRGGTVRRSNLRDMELRVGDAILLFGRRDRLKVLAEEPDFIGLTESVQEPPRTNRAAVATIIFAGSIGVVVAGLLSLPMAVLVGATLVVVTRCLTLEEAYRAIELPAIILIAGMLPLGTALNHTGAARLISELAIGITGGFGPRGVLAGLCIMTALGAQVLPIPALVVLMSPIALSTAIDLGLSPHTLMMGVALSAGALASPVSHAANTLIMGPGGYRYADYVRIGLPLTVIVLVLVVLVVPMVFPF